MREYARLWPGSNIATVQQAIAEIRETLDATSRKDSFEPPAYWADARSESGDIVSGDAAVAVVPAAAQRIANTNHKDSHYSQAALNANQRSFDHLRRIKPAEMLAGDRALASRPGLDTWALAKARFRGDTTVAFADLAGFDAAPFSWREMANALASLKRGKAPKPGDDITADILLGAGPVVHVTLLFFFNAICRRPSAHFPSLWRRSVEVGIYKGKNKDRLNYLSHRPIQFVPTMSKLYEYCLRFRDSVLSFQERFQFAASLPN